MAMACWTSPPPITTPAAGPSPSCSATAGAGLRPVPGSPFAAAGQPYYVAMADVNGDRRVDLVATHNDDGRATVSPRDGRGRFAPSSGSPVDLGHRAWGGAITDVDRDGKSDLIAAAGDSVRVMLGDGRGGFAPGPGSPFPAGRALGGLPSGTSTQIVSRTWPRPGSRVMG